MNRQELVDLKDRLFAEVAHDALQAVEPCNWGRVSTLRVQELFNLHAAVCKQLELAQAEELAHVTRAKIGCAIINLENALNGGALVEAHIRDALAMLCPLLNTEGGAP